MSNNHSFGACFLEKVSWFYGETLLKFVPYSQFSENLLFNRLILCHMVYSPPTHWLMLLKICIHELIDFEVHLVVLDFFSHHRGLKSHERCQFHVNIKNTQTRHSKCKTYFFKKGEFSTVLKKIDMYFLFWEILIWIEIKCNFGTCSFIMVGAFCVNQTVEFAQRMLESMSFNNISWLCTTGKPCK